MQAVEVGSRVRALREAKGLSLRDLAGKAGVSAPMLSQVERGETSPTLAVAGKIAAGLDLSLSQLLRLDETASVAIVRAASRRSTQRDGHTIEELTPPLPGQPATVSMHTLKRGASTSGPPLHEAGGRETAVVSSGKVALCIDGERYVLQPGDAVTFDADLPHHFENASNGTSVFTAVVTHGLRRA